MPEDELEIPQDIMTFPCRFRLKTIGLNEEGFKEFVMAAVGKHVAGLNEEDFTDRFSNGEKYLSVTAKFVAESREQLDTVYRELSSDKRVILLI